MDRKAIFSGTFDPFTIAHQRIVERSLQFFDKVIIAIGNNSDKKTLYSHKERSENIQKIFSNNSNVTCIIYTNTLTADFVRIVGGDFILRGIRNTIDFEYEKNMADINRELLGVETIFLFSEPEYSYISSSLVREFIKYNKDVSNLIPKIT